MSYDNIFPVYDLRNYRGVSEAGGFRVDKQGEYGEAWVDFTRFPRDVQPRLEAQLTEVLSVLNDFGGRVITRSGPLAAQWTFVSIPPVWSQVHVELLESEAHLVIQLVAWGGGSG